ncbi:PPOX class F420-dependent oxidoreductase [Nocardia terpenica]|uniref:PPOX class F420-dependent enzyme n=1 Tax=Nocardia terpenica TaxID=455432 RepID=A0A164MU82_9NOCA|nr:PPOX class F420-dependent oxidoreductase [Nocardia terpenica]KZM73666.1 PPOX class F420-dependent enzyme [Nocardia terpenica]MBF6066258.1 PPOX class F420-dependent oxidoreductase [Nocardia terpenica]MBF6109322.1 PPOX class F420-dependent oxidoreductase [Nocardia terpenica]MBF6116556.1 PPOX class F420-dependent oxidoreductase [Nocardia terpenica]MBF6123623.1 PPOX class F420-dependent oxidoreductase [Nocardia terpenica]
MTEIPEKARDLLERPVYASLGTTRPDGAPQVNPMWFVWDGELIWFTHTNFRQKFKNIANEPRVSISIFDPDNPYRYLEVRGVVDHIDADPEGALYTRLSQRYGLGEIVPPDAKDRVAIAVRPTGAYGNATVRD